MLAGRGPPHRTPTRRPFNRAAARAGFDETRAPSASSSRRVWSAPTGASCCQLGGYLHSADPCYCSTAGVNHPAITTVVRSAVQGRQPVPRCSGADLGAVGYCARDPSICAAHGRQPGRALLRANDRSARDSSRARNALRRRINRSRGGMRQLPGCDSHEIWTAVDNLKQRPSASGLQAAILSAAR